MSSVVNIFQSAAASCIALWRSRLLVAVSHTLDLISQKSQPRWQNATILIVLITIKSTRKKILNLNCKISPGDSLPFLFLWEKDVVLLTSWCLGKAKNSLRLEKVSEIGLTKRGITKRNEIIIENTCYWQSCTFILNLSWFKGKRLYLKKQWTAFLCSFN